MKQQYKHSNEVKKTLHDTGTGYYSYRRGDRSGFYSDLDKDIYLHIKDGEIGPTQSDHIVTLFKLAGILGLIGMVLFVSMTI